MILLSLNLLIAREITDAAYLGIARTSASRAQIIHRRSIYAYIYIYIEREREMFGVTSAALMLRIQSRRWEHSGVAVN